MHIYLYIYLNAHEHNHVSRMGRKFGMSSPIQWNYAHTHTQCQSKSVRNTLKL